MSTTIENHNISNITDIFDFSDPVKDVYLLILKMGSASLEDFAENADSQIDKHELKIYLNILVRQEYLEKYKDNNIVRYKIKGLDRKARSVPESIWNKLKDV